MTAIRLASLILAVIFLTACEPSPKEATELFISDLKAGNWKSCASFFTPELRAAFEKEAENWPVLAFAQSYYSDSVNCSFLKYETKEGKAHTVVSYTWRWTRAPMPSSVILDLIWRPMDGKWRIENIYATSHWDMLLPVAENSPESVLSKAHLSTCGLRYHEPYRGSDSWDELGSKMEKYLETWYR